MLREMFIAKLHRGVITGCHLDYQGSITIDQDLLDRAGILVHQRVQVLDLNNGERFETYAIPGQRGGGEIIINGAAARLVQAGDRVIVIAYGLCTDDEARSIKPAVLLLDERNRVISGG